jgi:hypothetical protein
MIARDTYITIAETDRRAVAVEGFGGLRTHYVIAVCCIENTHDREVFIWFSIRIAQRGRGRERWRRLHLRGCCFFHGF